MMRSRLMCGMIVTAMAAPLMAEPTTQPSAASVISAMDAAYSQIQSAQFDGHITGHFDVQGTCKNYDVPFTSSFAAPNKFRHQAVDDVLVISTGKKVSSYLSGRNEYESGDTPQTRVACAAWPASVGRVLKEQNPSLLLAMSKSASFELNQLSKSVELQPTNLIDGVAYDTLVFGTPADPQTVTMLVDPATHLLHEAKFNLQKAMERSGVIGVKQAEITVYYTKSAVDVSVAANLFDWTAPAGAVLITAAVDAPENPITDAMRALIGKDASDFSLKRLDDKTVKLSDSKGSVVILDFWATWCAPCVEALPNLDKLNKDQSANGVKIFAINEQEDKDKIKTFVQKKGWTLPVLLDTDAVAAGLYKAEEFPETVIIGKDGKIKQIFGGIGHEEEIEALVAKELK